MPNFELIIECYEIIDGIPENRIDLDVLAQQVTDGKGFTSCGTLACGAGWLAQHPKFNALGLSSNKYGVLKWKGKVTFDFGRPLMKLFDLKRQEVVNIFGSFYMGGYDKDYYKVCREWSLGTSHKELFKYRVRRFLLDCNQAVTTPTFIPKASVEA